MTLPLTRRRFLRALTTSAAAGLAGCHGGLSRSPAPAADPMGEPAAPPEATAHARGVAAFVGHGSPETALNEARGSPWRAWAQAMPRPRAILVVSAHWEQAPATLGATTRRPLIYDFYGFPRPLYEVRYDPPPAPALADRVQGLLAGTGGSARAPDRGLDHGAWVPLRWMFPLADVPTLTLSLPTQDPAGLARVGRALAPLLDEEVLLLGSGNVVHNLRALAADGAPTPSWAVDFDAWTAEALAARDLDALVDYRRRAPAPDRAHPTKEHFIPLLVVAAAGFERGGAPRFPVTGFEAGSISRRCVEL